MKKRITLSANLIIIVVVTVIVLGIAIWIRVDRTGEVRGTVLYPDGTPAAGVEVRLRERVHNLIGSGIFTYTDEEGRFTFTDLEMIEFIVDAAVEAESLRSEPIRYHLYFKGQDYELPEPIRLQQIRE